MDKVKLNLLLSSAKLKKKDLSILLGVAQSTVNNWGSSKEIPYWLESWLNFYIKAKTYDEMRLKICDENSTVETKRVAN